MSLWVISVPLIAGSLLYWSLNKKMVVGSNLFKNSFYLNRWLSLFILFSIVFICVFPAYWATGMLGQHRTLNVAYFFFLIMWFTNLTVWYNYYDDRLSIKLKKNRRLYLVTIMIAALIFTGNGYNALKDIFGGSANSFNKEQVKRFKLLSDAQTRKAKDLVLTPISAKPKSLYTYDVTSDPKDWRNQAYNLYFRLDSMGVYLVK
jgi:uncharacterized membrane protein YkvI